MKKILLLFNLMAGTTMAYSQEFSADKLLDLLMLTIPKTENRLLDKKYTLYKSVYNADTLFKAYRYSPAPQGTKKRAAADVSRKFLIFNSGQTNSFTYQTISKQEFSNIIKALKKKGFHCKYETEDRSVDGKYLYQFQDYTAETAVFTQHDTSWYSIAFDKKTFSVDRELHFAEDLLQFSSHEYLVYYFGEKNVKKDLYYFGEQDIVSCSVLLMNTDRQVIFVWSDGLNYRKINSLLLGGEHRLKSQGNNVKFIPENKWPLKCGLRAGMPLYDLRNMNQKDISFCGGYAPNPGLVFPESTGRIDFKNMDVILGCVNCDETFQEAKLMNADHAIRDGRKFFVLTIVLYPEAM